MDFQSVPQRRGTYSAKYDETIEKYGEIAQNWLPMSIADMDFLAPQEVQEALIKRFSQGIYGYTGAYQPALAQAVGGWFERRHQLEIDPNWLVFGDTLLSMISRMIREFTCPGDAIVISPPVYPAFKQVIELQNRKAALNPLRLGGKGYEMDLEGLEKLFSQGAAMMILCSPHNPIGKVWSRQTLVAVRDLCRRYEVCLLSDEAHGDIVYPPYQHTPLAALIDPCKDQAISLFSPHKTFNLAGLQVSGIISPHAQMRARVQQALYREGIKRLGIAAVEGSLAAYRFGDAWLEALLKVLLKNRDTLLTHLAKHANKARMIAPQATYLAWIDFQAYGFKPQDLTRRLQEESALLLNEGTEYGEGFESCRRLNFAVPDAVLQDALERLDRGFSSC